MRLAELTGLAPRNKTIQIPVGTFNTCKLLVVNQAKGISATKEQKWIAAEGSFRGHELKWGSPDSDDS
jgi:hypothetical protein